jgi:hypothetical protein
MGYAEAIAGVGLKPIVDELLGDYQGDWVAIVNDEDSWKDNAGFLVYGYGSCSGCDEWQAAETALERVDIVRSMVERVKWFDSLTDLKEFINGDHPELEWYGHDEEWVGFKAKVNSLTPGDLY